MDDRAWLLSLVHAWRTSSKVIVIPVDNSCYSVIKRFVKNCRCIIRLDYHSKARLWRNWLTGGRGRKRYRKRCLYCVATIEKIDWASCSLFRTTKSVERAVVNKCLSNWLVRTRSSSVKPTLWTTSTRTTMLPILTRSMFLRSAILKNTSVARGVCTRFDLTILRASVLHIEIHFSNL